MLSEINSPTKQNQIQVEKAFRIMDLENADAKKNGKGTQFLPGVINGKPVAIFCGRVSELPIGGGITQLKQTGIKFIRMS